MTPTKTQVERARNRCLYECRLETCAWRYDWYVRCQSPLLRKHAAKVHAQQQREAVQ